MLNMMLSEIDADRELPEHRGSCYVCGGADDRGLRARRFIRGDRVVLRFISDPRHEGAVGLVHGGVISALFDEALGSVPPHLLGRPCVTGTLTVAYRAQAPVGGELRVEAWLEGVERRKVFLAGAAYHQHVLVAEATATFIEMPRSHFTGGDPSSKAIRP
jgi:acyl-coenzyme A thioesterase PaaI-like protein